MQEPIEEAAPEPTLAQINEQKAAFLFQNGVPVPRDQVYMVSLLEFLCGDELEAAKQYHEERFGAQLDRALANRGAASEQAAAAQRRAELLRG